jgi:sulfate adenylyltransferase subunit 2
MKTEALKDALDKHGFDAAFGGARRDEEKSRAKERVYSFRDRSAPVGPEEPAPGAVEPLQRQGQQGRVDPRVPALQLDRAGRLAIHPPGEHPDRAAVLRGAAAGGERDGTLIMVDDERMRLLPGESRKPVSSASARSAATR